VEVCSFIAARNVLRLQRLLHWCGKHLDTLKEKEQAESGEGKRMRPRMGGKWARNPTIHSNHSPFLVLRWSPWARISVLRCP
jgi:hypothetical protein